MLKNSVTEFQAQVYLFKHGIGKTNILRHGLAYLSGGFAVYTHTCITFDVTRRYFTQE